MNAKTRTTRSHYVTSSRLMIALAIATWLTITPSSAEQRGRIQSENTITRIPTSALLTGDSTQLRNAIATAGATAEIRLTPVANHPGGPYGHNGYYNDASINGNRLSVESNGGRTFWNMQMSNWGPSEALLWGYQGYILADGFLGANADCGGGPGSCPSTGDLTLARPPCSSIQDCVDEFREDQALCAAAGCEPAFINTTRPDFVFVNAPQASLITTCAFTTADEPICAAVVNIDNADDARADQPGVQFYGATFVIDVPPGSEGLYTLEWLPPQSFMSEFTNPGQQDIPLAALVPGELDVFVTVCPEYDPLTHCGDPETCETNPIPFVSPCDDFFCDGAIPVVTRLPAGTPCTPVDTCIINTTCSSEGQCLGTPTLGRECTKPRFITFTPVDDGGALSGISVRFVSLHRPTPPYSPGVETADFSGFEGAAQWVGEPFDCIDSATSGTVLKCATLTCTPTFIDWTPLTGGQPVHITGDAILPSSVYDLIQFPEFPVQNEPPLRIEYGIRTARWGDVGPPFQDVSATRNQPNVTDIVFVVDKVKDVLGALAKPRILMRDNFPDPTLPANSTDIVLTVDAVKGAGFPYDGPTPCSQ
jgi:hypothetical protein